MIYQNKINPPIKERILQSFLLILWLFVLRPDELNRINSFLPIYDLMTPPTYYASSTNHPNLPSINQLVEKFPKDSLKNKTYHHSVSNQSWLAKIDKLYKELENETSLVATDDNKSPIAWSLLVGHHPKKIQALKQANSLKALGYDSYVTQTQYGIAYDVLIGSKLRKEDILTLQVELRKLKIYGRPVYYYPVSRILSNEPETSHQKVNINGEDYHELNQSKQESIIKKIPTIKNHS